MAHSSCIGSLYVLKLHGRIYLQCHTIEQVAAGALVGAFTGSLWYLLYLKVRKFGVLMPGSAGILMGGIIPVSHAICHRVCVSTVC